MQANTNPLYEVERILGRRNKCNNVEFLVSWKGYSLVEATWEPLQNLLCCSDLLSGFLLKSKPIPGASPGCMSERFKRQQKFRVKMITTRSRPAKRKLIDSTLLQESICQNAQQNKHRRLSESEKLVCDTLKHESRTMSPILPVSSYQTSKDVVLSELMNGFSKHSENGDVCNGVYSDGTITPDALQDCFKRPSPIKMPDCTRPRRTVIRDTGEGDYVLTRCQDGCLVVTLNNTAGRNLLNVAMMDSLTVLVNNAGRTSSTNAMAIRNNGDYFCCGIDYNELLDCPTDKKWKDKATEIANAASNLTLAFVNFKKPLLVAANGPCLGFGLMLVLLSDFCYISSKTYFELPFVRLGLTPIGCISSFLPRIVGNKMSNSMLLLGERCHTVTAYDHGLVTDVFGINSFDEDINKKLKTLSRYHAEALASTKLLLMPSDFAETENKIKEETAIFLSRLKDPSTKEYLREQWIPSIHANTVAS